MEKILTQSHKYLRRTIKSQTNDLNQSMQRAVFNDNRRLNAKSKFLSYILQNLDSVQAANTSRLAVTVHPHAVALSFTEVVL